MNGKTILYFSPTGNAKYIAEKLALRFGSDAGKPLALEFTDPETLSETDHLIILYSIHAFNAPKTVRRFVGQLPRGLCTSVSLIAVGCAESWVNAAATTGLRKSLEAKGYTILEDRVIAMPLTFIMSFPDELGRKLITDAETKLDDIADKIKMGVPAENEVSFRSRAINFLGKAEAPAARLFGMELHADKNCTSCGICVKGCPEKNIRFNSKDKPVFGLKCLMCMRCVYNCPEDAISPRLAKFIPIKGGYRLDHYQDSSSNENGDRS